MPAKAKKTALSCHASAGTPDSNGRVLCIRMTMQPKDVNGRGRIFGGRLLELMDLAGAYIAHRACKDRFLADMVTRVTKEVQFTKPVHVNDSITAWGTIIAVGKTSVTVRIEVEADRVGEIIPVTSCIMVFVNVDDNDNPVSIHGTPCGDASAQPPTAETAVAQTDTAPSQAKDDKGDKGEKTTKKSKKNNKKSGCRTRRKKT
jgi:acyl-CoA thioesterase YciA